MSHGFYHPPLAPDTLPSDLISQIRFLPWYLANALHYTHASGLDCSCRRVACVAIDTALSVAWVASIRFLGTAPACRPLVIPEVLCD
jgi:hypothetical protein